MKMDTMELNLEEMETVNGGWTFNGLFGAVSGGGLVGGVAGACVGGFLGTVVGGTVGAVTGAVVYGVTCWDD